MKNQETLVEPGTRGGGGPKSDNLSAAASVAVGLASLPSDLVVSGSAETVELVSRAITSSKDGAASCQVKFDIKLSASDGVIIAKMDSEANLEIKVIWKRASDAHE